MKKSILAASVAALVFTACGGGGSDQDKVADALIKDAKDQSVDIDEACVKRVISDLSDEDAKKALDLPDGADIGDADLSPEGVALTEDLFTCVDIGSLIDEQIAALRDQGIDFDEQCVRDAFDSIDLAAVGESGVLPDEAQSALIECINIGG